MALVNENFLRLAPSYLFSDIAKKVNAFRVAHPKTEVVRLGIGDVTRPLCPAVIEAMQRAVAEMADAATFHGYGPEQGYDFLREAIVRHDYAPRGVQIDASEVFVSDGAKSDTGNIGDILSKDNIVGLTDPVYPVYADSNAMAGRAGTMGSDGRWTNIVYMPCNEQNDFVPELPTQRVDAVYLCYPNNPTGTVITREQLKRWVDWALKNDTLILYDAAYEAFIQDAAIPHSIYEIKGAKRCAIEFRSFSKTAGFTGVRCGYTVVPRELTAQTLAGERIALHGLWNRRQCTKFNGASYITQRGAAAVYTSEGQAQTRETIAYYLRNARRLREALTQMGFSVRGGENAPYIWLRVPEGRTSWQFFDDLLYGAGVVGTPGVGFGPSGEGYFRFTAFGTEEDCERAVERIRKWKG